jgi:hypothetical protein
MAKAMARATRMADAAVVAAGAVVAAIAIATDRATVTAIRSGAAATVASRCARRTVAASAN